MKIVFEELRGAHAGRRAEFHLARIRVGRAPDSDLSFDAQRDLQASYSHAEVRIDADGIVLIDLGSSNGTFVNGKRVHRAKLHDGDVLEFGHGGPVVKLYAEGPATPAQVGAGLGRATPRPGDLAKLMAVVNSAGASLGRSARSPAAATPAPAGALPAEVARAVSHRGPAAVTPAPSGKPGSSGKAAPSGTPAPSATPADDATAATSYDPPQSSHAPDADDHAGPGKKTVALMISDAMALAKAHKTNPLGKGTVFLRAIVNQAVAQSNRRHRWLIVGLAVLSLSSIGAALAGYFLRQPGPQMSATYAQSNSVGGAIARENRNSIFLLAVRRANGTEGPFCTGFAVRVNLLATNAHCIENALGYRARGFALVAIMNGDGSTRFDVRKLYRHPLYREGALTPDVGLIEVATPLPRVVRLAGLEELRSLTPGETMYTYGFPGRLANPKSPEATFVQGVIGRLTTMAQTPGRFDETVLIQHSAFTTGGTSGSPIFDTRGIVVGLNAGGFRGKEEVFLDDARAARGAKPQPLSIQQALSGYNYGMRIDLLAQLLGPR